MSPALWPFGLLALLFGGYSCANILSISAFGNGLPGRPATMQGSSDRKALIEVRTPPSVYLPGPTVNTRVTSLKPVTQRVPESIQQAIQETLLRNDPRLRAASNGADTLISCTITDLGVSRAVEARTRPEYRRIGQRTVTDSQTGAYHTEDEYGFVDVAYRALVIAGRMTVQCEVKDVATGVVIYTDSFDAVYSEAREVGFGSGAVAVDDLNSIYLRLADNAAGLILAVLCPRVYSDIVALPSGSLRETSKLLEASLWAEALSRLVSLHPFKDPQDEAYRLYSIAVAHEALAYEAQNPVEVKKRLELAADHYRQATQLKPRENTFWAPKNRADLSLWQATGLVAHMEAFENAKQAGAATTGPDPSQVAARTDLFRQARRNLPPPPSVITNETVIGWVKSGRSADYIASGIKHAPGTQFDLSPAAQLKLRREGVSNATLKAMRESQQGPRYGLSTRTRAIIMAASVLWWIPFLVGR